MPQTVLSSVGTSLLSNSAKSMAGLPTTDQLVRFAKEIGAEKASAELNALHRLAITSKDKLVFMHSDTDEGALCAEALSRYSRQIFAASTEVLKIDELLFAASKFRNTGLRGFTNTVIKQIVEARRMGNDVVINATGGFKAQIAFATAIGLVFQVPVYYIHEHFDSLVKMPALPIGWDIASLVDIEPIIAQIQDGIAVGDLDRMLSSYAPDARLRVHALLDDSEDFPVLNELGYALYTAYRVQGEAVGDGLWLTKDARRSLDKIIGTSNEQRIRMLLQRLQDPVFRSKCEQKGNSDCLFFPKGHCAERIAFYEDGEGRVVVVDIFLSHKDCDDRVDSRELQRQFFAAESAYIGT